MGSSERDDDVVGQLYDATVRPERLLEVVEAWDARLDAADPAASLSAGGFNDAAFLGHLARALAVLDALEAAEDRRLEDLLAGMAVAAMVLTETGVVAAASPAARSGLGLYPGGSIRLIPAPRPEIEELASRVAAVAAGGAGGRDAVLRLSLAERSRPVILHLRAVAGRGRRQVLAVSSEFAWSAAVEGVLGRVFGMTGAEVALTRRLTAGETVREIAREDARSEGTVRSQLHSALGKAGLKSQGELVRLAQTLLQAAALEPDPPQIGSNPVESRRLMRLSDGRRLAVLRFGDPGGRPILWLMASLGLFQPTVSGERELRRRGLRLIVPIRAGYGASDPPPPGRDPTEMAIEDIAEALDQIGVRRCPVVAPFFEIRAALGLARRWPERVERIVGVGSAYPSGSVARFRRQRGAARFFIAITRFAPHLLPFVIRTFHARLRAGGLDEFLRGYYREQPGDARLFAEDEVAEAVVGAFTYARCQGPAALEAFRLDVLAGERPWPAGLGRVACPVDLLHGEGDWTAPAGTAREVAAAHPGWRYHGIAGAGGLVAYDDYSRVLDLATGRAGGSADAAAE